MRMLIIAIAALPLAAATAQPAERLAPAEAPAPAEPADAATQPIRFVELDPEDRCPKPLADKDWPREPLEPKKLTELPPADAFHAVVRLDEKGCLDPVMVGYQHRDGR